MAVKLNKEQLENIKNYQYKTNPPTYLDGVFNHYWEFVVNCLSRKIAPNLLTCLGIVMPIASWLYQIQYDTNQSNTLPVSVLLFNAFAMFWFQTLDAIDGKQARRTDNCSCLGQLLDHCFDQFNYSFFTAQTLALLKTKNDFLAITMIVLGHLVPHYTIQYRNHFQNYQNCIVDCVGGFQMGITEQLLLMYGWQIAFALCPSTNEFVDAPIDFKGRFGFDLPFKVTLTYFIAGGLCFIPAVQYNWNNLKEGFMSAKDKKYAVFISMPFFMLFIIMYMASLYSQFWDEYCAFFMLGLGIWLSHTTGLLNLMSSAKSSFNPIFPDPFVFMGILYVDYNQILPQEQVVYLYIGIVLYRMMQYILFMSSMITQICDYCNISFLKVKPETKVDKKNG